LEIRSNRTILVDSVIVRTGSRLHFGLLQVPAQAQASEAAEPAEAMRAFGGVGLMVDEPEIAVRVRRTDAPRTPDPADDLAVRAGNFAAEIAAGLEDDSPLLVDVLSSPSQHVGLGVGTQLAMAVGTAVAALLGRPLTAEEIAVRVGRGQRSGIGLHGFLRGGFLVDGGKGPAGAFAPIVCRHDFPDEWRVLLVSPSRDRGLSGDPESKAFARLKSAAVTRSETDALCRIVLFGLLPALVERDLRSFGEALHEFNRRAGLPFAEAQGGIYASPVAAEIHDWLRASGIGGVGQSSWGPTLFAIGEADRLRAVEELLRKRFGAITRVVAARNCGYETV
jgi:beta-ribofuranosylaminobenzene 5'-phosphate synthase